MTSITSTGRYDVLTFDSEAEWLGDDKAGAPHRKISGTGMAHLFVEGSPWYSPWKLYQQCLGLSKPIEKNFPMQVGVALEPLLIAQATKRLKLDPTRVEQCLYTIYRLVGQPWITVTPDAVIYDDDGRIEDGIEGKYHSEDRAGDYGVDTYPEAEEVQCRVAMMVTGAKRWRLVVTIGGREPLIYTIPRDELWEREAQEKARKFWHDHVLTCSPPPVDSSKECEQMLLKQVGDSKGVVDVSQLENPQRITDKAITYQGVKAKIAILNEQDKRLKNELIVSMGGNRKLTGPFGSIYMVTKGGYGESVVRYLAARWKD